MKDDNPNLHTYEVRLLNGHSVIIKDAVVGKLLDGCVLFHNAEGSVVGVVPVNALSIAFDVTSGDRKSNKSSI